MVSDPALQKRVDMIPERFPGDRVKTEDCPPPPNATSRSRP